MDDPKKDRIDERVQEDGGGDPPNPDDRLDERVEQLPAPTNDRLEDEDDDGPAAA